VKLWWRRGRQFGRCALRASRRPSAERKRAMPTPASKLAGDPGCARAERPEAKASGYLEAKGAAEAARLKAVP